MLNPADAELAARLGALGLEAVPAGAAYLEEPRGRLAGVAGLLVRPRTVEEVAALLRACSAARVGVVPYGGGTGLVGGQVLTEGSAPVTLSLERMAALRAVDPVGNVAIVEAGMTLQAVQEAAAEVGRVFPLTLASQGSARIGGCLATNAGGVNVLRYGNARDLCLGLEAVLADGTILRGLKRLRKDNTGYDLRGLLVGSEGTLGVITAASLRLFPRPAAEGTAMLAVASPAAALDLLALAEARMAGCVSAFELIHRQGLAFLEEVMPKVRQPFVTRPEWSVLIEVGLPEGIDPQVALAGLFEAGAKRGLVCDGVIAQGAAQRAAFWRLRESLPEANRRIGSISSHDISVPLSDLPAFIDRAGPALAALGDMRVNCFGHVGDGNLHYNVFPAKGRSRAEYEHLRGPIKACVHGIVDAFGGSVSAEHGVGRIKRADLERYADPGKLAAMRAIKAALDPLGILNPGAVIG
ncbi:FAD-binding oxidoreductase [Candidatus Falkowbacteria bacterium]|nr:FAD-binding oxidoreductase [Candidatus Falkowbacteria bacterium]